MNTTIEHALSESIQAHVGNRVSLTAGDKDRIFIAACTDVRSSMYAGTSVVGIDPAKVISENGMTYYNMGNVFFYEKVTYFLRSC
jgi:hypothetical protein